MEKLYGGLATAYFIVATLSLMALAFAILLIAVWDVAAGIFSGAHANAVLSGVSLLVIGFAVIETAKFIAEEEILRKRELRSASESRRSITKFVTIIVIASSLEALVMVFQASRENISLAIYPALLFVASMFALLALGVYQWLSSRIRGGENHILQDGKEHLD